MSKRKMYGIYLPESNEMWFKSTFELKTRAIEFAEHMGLDFDDYEVRDTDSVVEPVVEPIVALEGAA